MTDRLMVLAGRPDKLGGPSTAGTLSETTLAEGPAL